MSFATTRHDFTAKPAGYASLAADLEALLAGEHDLIANAANTAALIWGALPELNWAGFYFLKREGLKREGLQDGELVLGPFQGRPACVRIALGRGVCGTAARERRTVVVPDVNAFPGHIACDAASRSEIVVPLVAGTALLGVLDLDSPRLARFDEEDRAGLERLAAIFVRSVSGPGPVSGG